MISKRILLNVVVEIYYLNVELVIQVMVLKFKKSGDSLSKKIIVQVKGLKTIYL